VFQKQNSISAATPILTIYLCQKRANPDRLALMLWQLLLHGLYNPAQKGSSLP